MREIKINGIYRHFKGDHYLVVDIANDSETMEKMVVYRQLYGEGKLFVRTLDMFLSDVDKEKYPNVEQEHRFELLDVETVVK